MAWSHYAHTLAANPMGELASEFFNNNNKNKKKKNNKTGELEFFYWFFFPSTGL